MSIQKKSLLSSLNTTKKAIVASTPAKPEVESGSVRNATRPAIRAAERNAIRAAERNALRLAQRNALRLAERMAKR